jgi:hypothetical protein
MGAFYDGTYCKELAKAEKFVYHAMGRPAPKPRVKRTEEEKAALKAAGGAGGPRKSGKKAEIEDKLAMLAWLIEDDSYLVSGYKEAWEEHKAELLKPVDVEEAEKSAEEEEEKEKEDD